MLEMGEVAVSDPFTDFTALARCCNRMNVS